MFISLKPPLKNLFRLIFHVEDRKFEAGEAIAPKLLFGPQIFLRASEAGDFRDPVMLGTGWPNGTAGGNLLCWHWHEARGIGNLQINWSPNSLLLGFYLRKKLATLTF